ncbi:MAG: hypothetical protein ACKKMS_00175 [Candidatus Nealsonbacteria bacterium]
MAFPKSSPVAGGDTGRIGQHNDLRDDVIDVNTRKVEKTGNETINGIKTFGSILLLPAANPTTDNQATRKKYVDSFPYAPKSGVVTKDIGDTVVTQVIPHGLGRVPKFVRITATWGVSNENQEHSISTGTYNGSTTATVYGWIFSANSGSGSSSTYMVLVYDGAQKYRHATIAIDATNITLTWSKESVPEGTARLLWEVF